MMSENEREPCLHCVLNEVMNRYAAEQHAKTGEPINIDHSIDDLMACAAELIAMYDDAKTRKFVLKRTQRNLATLTRERRAEGRYPGGPGQVALPEWPTEH